MYKRLSKDVYSFLGCEFNRNGDVYSRYGKKVKRVVGKNNIVYVIVKPEEMKRKRLNLSRIIYEMFSGKVLGENESVSFKDGNPLNVSYENLTIIPKNRPKGKSPERRFTKEQVEEIKMKYFGGTKSRNQFDKKADSVSMRDLMKEYDCSVGTIERIIHGTYFRKDEKDA